MNGLNSGVTGNIYKFCHYPDRLQDESFELVKLANVCTGTRGIIE